MHFLNLVAPPANSKLRHRAHILEYNAQSYPPRPWIRINLKLEHSIRNLKEVTKGFYRTRESPS